MKKGIVIALVICLLFAQAQALAAEPYVIAVNFPAYDFARAVAGDRARIRMLLKPGSEAHIYEPTPRDLVDFGSCDLFVYGGGESDVWVDRLMSAVWGDDGIALAMMDQVELIEEDGEDGEYDEHVWTSPRNAIKIVAAIRDSLCRIDPEGEAYYTANAGAYIEELERLDAAFEEVVANADRTTIIYGDRFPLIYFAREYGISYIAAFPGCSSETEPNAATMAALIKGAREIGAPVVLYLELSNGAIARAVAEEIGAQTAVFYACHNVTQDDFDAGKRYVDFMWENVETLKWALNGEVGSE